MPKKGGVGQFADLRGGGLGKKWSVFEWGGGTDTPMHTMNLAIFLTVVLIYRCQFTDKDLFFRTIHTKTTSNSQRNKK